MFVTIIENENHQTLKLIEKCSKKANCYECKFFKTNKNCFFAINAKKTKNKQLILLFCDFLVHCKFDRSKIDSKN